jgi:hypothetical protein
MLADRDLDDLVVEIHDQSLGRDGRERAAAGRKA